MVAYIYVKFRSRYEAKKAKVFRKRILNYRLLSIATSYVEVNLTSLALDNSGNEQINSLE